MLLIFMLKNWKNSVLSTPYQKYKYFFGQTDDFSLLGSRKGKLIKNSYEKGEKCPFQLHRGQKGKFLKIIPFKFQLTDQRIVKK